VAGERGAGGGREGSPARLGRSTRQAGGPRQNCSAAGGAPVVRAGRAEAGCSAPQTEAEWDHQDGVTGLKVVCRHHAPGREGPQLQARGVRLVCLPSGSGAAREGPRWAAGASMAVACAADVAGSWDRASPEGASRACRMGFRPQCAERQLLRRGRPPTAGDYHARLPVGTRGRRARWPEEAAAVRSSNSGKRGARGPMQRSHG